MSEFDSSLHNSSVREISQKDSFQELDWKKTLHDVNPLSIVTLSHQKNHAQFSKALREMCPETDWIFIRDDHYSTNENLYLTEIGNIFKKMISSPDWPFPDKIIVTIGRHEIFRTWSFSISHNFSKLPLIDQSEYLVASTFTDIHSHGIKFNPIQSFGQNRSGEA